MSLKKALTSTPSFIKKGAKYHPILWMEPIEAYKILIEVLINPKKKSAFKIDAKFSNNFDTNIYGIQSVYNVSESTTKGDLLIGDPSVLDRTLLNMVILEYKPEIEDAEIDLAITVYEIDEETRKSYPSYI